MSPRFLSFTEVLKIHQNQISLYGGDDGIRDVDLLKSALGVPCTTYGGSYLHTNICEMAAAYLFHLVQNHPFIDGNKRTGAVAAIVFLILNGYKFDASEDELVEMVLGVARGELNKADIAVFINERVRKS